MSTFTSMLAVDENNYPLPNATGQLFAPSDTGATTPLDITDLNGIAFAGNVLIANGGGVLPYFRCVGLPVVDWVSGTYRIPIPAIDLVPAGGTTGQILSKKSGTDFDFEWIDPPTGGGLGSITYADLPAGTTLTVIKTGPTWPVRPTNRTDLIVHWKGANPSPPIDSTYMLNNVDVRLVTS